MRVAPRVDRLRVAMAGAGCDALLVTHLVNLRYLTGFTGSAGLLLVTSDGLLFVSDGRYRDQAAEQLAAAGVEARVEITGTEQRQVVAGAVADAGTARIGLEAEHVSWAQQRRYAEEWFGSTELVATTGLVEGLRLVKDEGEVARMAAAARIADDALAHVRSRLREGPTEAEVALELDTEMRRLGAVGPSFETIVAAGPNGAKPHARPSSRRIAEGDLVVIDFGAVVDGYCSDMTRTVVVGEPTATQQRMWDVVAEAQQAGVDAVAPGAAAADVDQACRSVIAAAGWGEAFLHATGHGVGLDIHEAPRVAATGDATLAAGNVVTVEPGVYLPDHGGVRIEDTLLVTDGGCRPLTRTPKRAAV
ncbi:MAG: Xaa-Pro peptidase family protein [Acidimicrobiales bacterium]